MFRRRRTIRRIARRSARRTSRRIHNMYLADEDANKIEQDTGKSSENLSEQELLDAMKKLGIKKLEVNEDQ